MKDEKISDAFSCDTIFVLAQISNLAKNILEYKLLPTMVCSNSNHFFSLFFWKFSIRPELITGKISSAHNSLYQTIFSSFMAKLWQNVAKSASSPRFQHSPAEDIYLQISISKNNTDCFWNKALVDTILLLILIWVGFS